MNIVNKVTLEQLKQNKKRTIITILGIAISVAMFVAVAITACSFTDMFERVEIEHSGKWHLAYVGVSGEKAKEALKDTRVESGYITYVPDETKNKEIKVQPKDCKITEKYHVYLFLKDLDEIETQANSMAKNLGVTSEETKYHSALLVFNASTPDRGFNSTLRNMALILIGIIMLGSISLIFNAFSISVSERGRYLGMLSSIGATRAQKRRSVFYEGLVLGGIGIPVGVLAGFGGMWITFQVVTPIIQKVASTSQAMHLVVNPKYLVLAIACSLISIVISACIPARRASRVTAIDAILQTKDIKLSSKKVRTKKITTRIFGFEASIGLKNLKRNRKRYRITVFALAINIVLFLGVASFGYYLSKAYDSEFRDCNYDITVHPNDGQFASKDVKALKGLKGITGSTMQTYSNDAFYSIPKEKASKLYTKQAKLYMEQEKEALKKDGIVEGESDAQVDIIGLDDSSYKKYAKECGITESTSDDSCILINRNKIRKGYSVSDIKMLNCKPGDSIGFNAEVGEERAKAIVNLKVAAVTDKCPMGTINSENEIVKFVVSEKTLQKIEKTAGVKEENSILYMTVDEKQKDAVAKKLDEMSEDSKYNVFNLYEQVQQIRRTTLLTSIFSYGFIGLITLICIANILNTVSTSMQLRRREMAMLRSVGMTPKGLTRMVRFESLFYGLKALLFGLPAGIGLMFLMYNSIANSIDMPFSLPIKDIIVAIVAVFLVIGTAMRYSVGKIRKENLIDALKSE